MSFDIIKKVLDEMSDKDIRALADDRDREPACLCGECVCCLAFKEMKKRGRLWKKK